MIKSEELKKEEIRLKKIVFCKCGELLQETYDEEVECPNSDYEMTEKEVETQDKLQAEIEMYQQYYKDLQESGIVCTGSIRDKKQPKQLLTDNKAYQIVKKKYDKFNNILEKKQREYEKKHDSYNGKCTQGDLAVWKFIQSLK